jgi:hypothetical protein
MGERVSWSSRPRRGGERRGGVGAAAAEVGGGEIYCRSGGWVGRRARWLGIGGGPARAAAEHRRAGGAGEELGFWGRRSAASLAAGQGEIRGRVETMAVSTPGHAAQRR